jgi:hypothetical protein
MELHTENRTATFNPTPKSSFRRCQIARLVPMNLIWRPFSRVMAAVLLVTFFSGCADSLQYGRPFSSESL